MLHHLSQVPERLHQYLPGDCYIVFVRRTKMVMSCSAEWNEMMWAVSRAVEVYAPQTLSTDSNGDAENRLVHHQAFPLMLADSHMHERMFYHVNVGFGSAAALHCKLQKWPKRHHLWHHLCRSSSSSALKMFRPKWQFHVQLWSVWIIFRIFIFILVFVMREKHEASSFILFWELSLGGVALLNTVHT